MNNISLGPKELNQDSAGGPNLTNRRSWNFNLIEYEYLSEIVKENLRLIKEELEGRREKIIKHGYNSNERILADEEIKSYIEDSKENLKNLKK